MWNRRPCPTAAAACRSTTSVGRAVQPQYAHPRRDRPRGDEHHSMSLGVQLTDLGHQPRDMGTRRNVPPLVVSVLDPILTTMRLAPSCFPAHTSPNRTRRRSPLRPHRPPADAPCASQRSIHPQPIESSARYRLASSLSRSNRLTSRRTRSPSTTKPFFTRRPRTTSQPRPWAGTRRAHRQPRTRPTLASSRHSLATASLGAAGRSTSSVPGSRSRLKLPQQRPHPLQESFEPRPGGSPTPATPTGAPGERPRRRRSQKPDAPHPSTARPRRMNASVCASNSAGVTASILFSTTNCGLAAKPRA